MGARPPLAALAALLTLACGPSQPAEAVAAPATEVLRLWPSAAPGTESWTGEEIELDADLPAGKVHIITNVTVPTLTVYRPPVGKANGTAMLVAPGGAFRALAWDLDGTEVAQWLTARGITAFVLKYRVRPPAQPPGKPAAQHEARDIAAADAAQALRLIRANAGRYALAKGRIGMIGFSAGGLTTMLMAASPDPAVRPDFAVPVYGGLPADQGPPAGGPPLFIVAAQDDAEVPSTESLEIYRRWTAAKLPAELHLYEKGGHGFGMRSRNLPLDQWPAALEAWLKARGLLVAEKAQGSADMSGR